MASVGGGIEHEQVAELYRNVTIGVLTAAAGAAVLSAALVLVGDLALRVAAGWTLFIAACAVAHLLLRRAYLRSATRAERWRFWGGWFTALSLVEGLAWGWASLSLADPARVDLQLLLHVVIYATAAGSIPAFGSYMPAFLAFYLPTVLPYFAFCALQTNPIHIAAAVLAFVFAVGMGGLGWRANRNFRAAVLVRLEMERLAADLRRQKELADAANRAKSGFLAAASHDLRQPVHALSLFVGALRGLKMEPEARRLVGHLESSVNAMDGLFNALLDISRLDAGLVQPAPQSFPIQPLLERICRDHRGEAVAKGLRLVLHPCGAIVHTDPILLERILRNLVANAVRYTDRGRVVVGARRGGRLRIQVCDTGRGIAPELHEHVFQEFFQLGNPERDRDKGLGLGLAIVRRLTALLGLTLALRSAPGRGSTFTLGVPLGTAAQAYAPAAGQELAGIVPRGLILVIDDEAAIQEAMRSLLASWGHRVIAAGSGAEMLERLASCRDRPDLIVCDYRLRAENGIEVIHRLQSEYNDDIPGVLITGDTAPERLIEAQRSGLLLLHKPVANAKLRAAIGHLLGSRAEAEPAG